MKLTMYQVAAFAPQPFSGNPAAVVPLDDWLPEETMQAIARENNLSETAFLVGGDGSYQIRWFTPALEVELCGHATLAAGWVVLNRLEPEAGEVEFTSQSGPLAVRQWSGGEDEPGDRLELNFPSLPFGGLSREVIQAVNQAVSKRPAEMFKGGHIPVAVYDRAGDIRELVVDPAPLIAQRTGLCVTAPGDEPDVDFVSRFFAPHAGIPEDPVTGAAHCALTPYWSDRLAKRSLCARQLSERGGEIQCEDRGHRIGLVGQVQPYLEGTIEIRAR